MLTVLVCLAVGLFVYIFFSKKGTISAYGVVCSQTISFLVGLFLAVLLIPILLPNNTEIKEGKRYKLVTIISSQNLKGNFFLLEGSVDVEDYYKFYYEQDDGARVFMKLNKGSVKIYEEDRKDAYFVQMKNRVYVKDYHENHWIIPLFCADLRTYDGDYAFHVPKGSIISEIDIKLR